jgi:ferredoxin
VIGLAGAPDGAATADVAHAPGPDGSRTELVAAARPRKVATAVNADACTQCELCLDSCSRGAIRLLEAPVVDQQTCTGCGACVNACPNGVFDLVEV